MPDTVRLLAAGVATLAYGGLCAAAFLGHRRRQRIAVAPGAAASRPVLVAYASQSGSAEELAGHTARSLGAAGQAATLLPLNRVSREVLAGHEQALFLVSTCGEGDAPDNGALFERRCMGAGGTPDLSHLHVGLLALGDRSYTHFCGFGRRLGAWLEACGAPVLFPSLEMDGQDGAVLATWQQQVAHIAGSGDTPDWRAPDFAPWRLLERRHLNPGSSGASLFHLALAPADGPLPSWQAGDLVQIQPPREGEHPRDYSIASLPAEGALHLLVRRQSRPDGSPGLASGWLCDALEPGRTLPLRLKPHPNFRLGDNTGRPLVLIGNGTGLAGLRALLKAREAAGEKRNWLFFGERHAAWDRPYREDLERWTGAGLLPRLDLAFSRETEQPEYVQHRLARQGEGLRQWLAEGAALYVCGSAATMGAAVDDTLAQLLGRDALDRLLAEGRYRRDVY